MAAMKSLSKSQQQERSEIITALNGVAAEVVAAVAIYHETMEEAKAPVEQAVEKYNEVLGKAAEFAERIAADGR